MVYCSKCGTKNEENAKICVTCGASLYPERYPEKRREECFGPRRERVEEECFGLPHGGAIVGIIFGALIILLGLATLLKYDIGSLIGPFILIVIGLLIMLGAIYGLSRRPSS